MKAQAFILQFILFFLIGFSIFVSTGNLLRFREHTFRTSLLKEMRELVGSYVEASVMLQKNCDCDSIFNLRLRNKTAERFIQVSLEEDGLKVITLPEGFSYFSPFFNLNQSYNLKGSAISVKPIKIIVNKTENYIEVKQ